MEEALPWLIGAVKPALSPGEDVAAAREYWRLILGPMLLLIVLYARGGIDGILMGHRRG